jgi:hypothetical protein
MKSIGSEMRWSYELEGGHEDKRRLLVGPECRTAKNDMVRREKRQRGIHYKEEHKT